MPDAVTKDDALHMKYWAFLSYSHADKRRARRLHRTLESFRIDPRLRDRLAPGIPDRTRLAPIFRDEDEMPAVSDLPRALKDALESSAALIVLCSPAAARSQWIRREIELFADSGPKRETFYVLLEGEPLVARGASPHAAAAFPPTAMFNPDVDFWLDLRPGRRDRFATTIRLVAGLLGLGFDDVWQREKRRARKRRALWAIAAGLGVISASTFLLHSSYSTMRFDHARRLEHHVASQLAESEWQPDRHQQATRLAIAALPPPGSLPSDSGAERIALREMDRAGLDAIVWDGGISGGALEFSPDGQWLAATKFSGTLTIWDTVTRHEVARLQLAGCENDASTFGSDCRFEAISFSRDGTRLAALTHGGELGVWKWEGQSFEAIFQRKLSACSRPDEVHHHPCPGKLLQHARDDATLIAATGDGRLFMLDSSDGTEIAMVHTLHGRTSHFSPDSLGEAVLVADGDHAVEIWSLAPAHRLRSLRLESDSEQAALAPGAQEIFVPTLDKIDIYSAVDGGKLGSLDPQDCGEPTNTDELDDLLGFYDPLFYCSASAIAFDASGERAALGYQGGTIEVWALATKSIEATLYGNERAADLVAMSPDGRQVASHGEDEAVRLYNLGWRVDASKPSPREVLCARTSAAEREFPEQERQSSRLLRLLDPDPCQWKGPLTVGFWLEVPTMLLRSLADQQPQSGSNN